MPSVGVDHQHTVIFRAGSKSSGAFTAILAVDFAKVAETQSPLIFLVKV
jgi:hypothetical protein